MLCRHIKKHHTAAGKSKHGHAKYKDEKHSLQGKTGKVCSRTPSGSTRVLTLNRHTLSASCGGLPYKKWK